jgi:large subunit ribosomal protein L21
MEPPMFAVIRTGGKQYRVAASDLIQIERHAGAAGDAVAFGEVLIVGGDDGIVVGAPLVSGATVAGEIVEHQRGPKIRVFKKRRRQNSKRTRGHRQDHTLVRITEILTDGKAPSRATAKAIREDQAAEAADATTGDDLKKLTGVGPAMEKKLRAFGVTSFADIAAWSDADIARAEEELKARGKVAEWVAQAKTLAGGNE